MFKKYFSKGVSLFAIGCMLNMTSCNSGSKDSITYEETGKSTTGIKDSAVQVVKTDTASIPKNEVTETAKPNSETKVVTIENMKFNPATITVKKGDKITFINKDIVAHNATEKNNLWASPLLANGQSWTFTPEKTSDYYCTVHVVMKAKIIVD